jgi:hypothetical protein
LRILRARNHEPERADAILAEALGPIRGSDWLNWQGNGFVALAEIRRLSGRIRDAIDAVMQASLRFAAKGNIVSQRRADQLATDLRVILAGATPGPAQPAVPA